MSVANQNLAKSIQNAKECAILTHKNKTENGSFKCMSKAKDSDFSDRDNTLHQQLVIRPGEVFNYELIKAEQSWKVSVKVNGIFKSYDQEDYPDLGLELHGYQIREAIAKLKKIEKALKRANDVERKPLIKKRKAREKVQVKKIAKILEQRLCSFVEAPTAHIAGKAIARREIRRIPPRNELEQQCIQIVAQSPYYDEILGELMEMIH